VCAVRIDNAPEGSGARTDPLWWRRVDDLPVTVAIWRAMLRRTARRDRIGIRTFLVPSTVDGLDVEASQLVYAMWINPPSARVRVRPHCTDRVQSGLATGSTRT
jgi:hypothetical protein